MPKNRFQKIVFALLSVLITVHAFVFYNLYIINGSALMKAVGTQSVLAAIQRQGGVFILNTYLPIWAIIAIELCFAFILEMFLGSPFSFKIARKILGPSEVTPFIFETFVIFATVWLMCPAMSLIAAWLYYPYYAGFHLLTLLANWMRLLCFNFPFALLGQLFFIQPVVRLLFRKLFCRAPVLRAEDVGETAVSTQ